MDIPKQAQSMKSFSKTLVLRFGMAVRATAPRGFKIKLALGPVTSVLFGWDQFYVVPMQRRR